MNICVFCSSSNHVAEKYKQTAAKLGRYIAENGHRLIYGGATGGLMDAVAEGAAEKHGEIIGIIPVCIVSANRQSRLPSKVIHTSDMSERKKQMTRDADIFIVLPGSYGTLDEMFHVIASGTVGEHKKPLICVNADGFYDNLIEHTNLMKSQKLIPKEESYKPVFVNSIEECIELVEKASRRAITYGKL